MARNVSPIYLDRKLIFGCLFCISWAFCTALFYEHIDSFLKAIDPFLVEWPSVGWFIVMPLGGLFIGGPFVGSATLFYEVINLSLKDPRFNHVRLFLSIALLGFTILFLQFLTLNEYPYYYWNAFVFTFTKPNYFKLAFIFYVVFIVVRGEDKHPANITKIAYVFLNIVFLMTFYLKLGIDDGCSTHGGDRLFGGDGYEVCDNDFVNLSKKHAEIANLRGFSSNTLFAAEMLLTQMIGLLALLTAMFFSKKS